MSSYMCAPRDDPFLSPPSTSPAVTAGIAGTNAGASPAVLSISLSAASGSVKPCSCSDSAYSSLYGTGPNPNPQHQLSIQKRRRSRPSTSQSTADQLLTPQCRTTTSFRAAYDLSPGSSEVDAAAGPPQAAAAAAGAAAATSLLATAGSISMHAEDSASRADRRGPPLLDGSDVDNEEEDTNFNMFDSTERLSTTSTLYSTVRRARLSRGQDWYSKAHSQTGTPALVIQNQARGSPYAFSTSAPCRSRHHCRCHGNQMQLIPQPPPPLETIQPELMFELMQQQQGASLPVESSADADDDHYGGWQLQMRSLQRPQPGHHIQRQPKAQNSWPRGEDWRPRQGDPLAPDIAAANEAAPSTVRLQRNDDACVHLRRRRGPGRNNSSSAGRRGCCCPLLVMSLCLGAVSVALLTVGGVFLGLHLSNPAHSAFLAAPPSDSKTAATPALVERADFPSQVFSTTPQVATSSATPSPTPDPAEMEVLTLKRELDRRLSGLVDTRTPPCRDFYQHACGNFDKFAEEILDSWSIGTMRRRAVYRPTDFAELSTALTADTLRQRLSGDFDSLGSFRAEQLQSAEGQRLLEAFRRCRLRLEVSAGLSDLCVAALQEAVPESVKSLLRYRSYNATAVHIAVVQLFNSAREVLNRRVHNSPNMSTHTRQSMTRKLGRIHPMIDSLGNADLSVLRHEFKNPKDLNRRLEQLYLQLSVKAVTPCLPEPCELPRRSFAACVCLTNSSDLWLPFSAINPPLFHLAYSDEVVYSYLGVSVAEVLYWSISPKHRTELFSSTSEHLLAKAFECFAKQLPGDKPNTVLIEALVAKHVSLSTALEMYRNSIGGGGSFDSGGSEIESRLQKFFLNWAQTQCSVDPLRSADNRLLLNAALQRQAEFSRVYRCQTDSLYHWSRAPETCSYP